VTIRPIEPSDAATWERLRRNLWPEDPKSHAVEIASFFAGSLAEPQAVLVAQEGPNLIAFAELSIREDFPGLAGKRVGYVEGLDCMSPRPFVVAASPARYSQPPSHGREKTIATLLPAIARRESLSTQGSETRQNHSSRRGSS